MTFTISVVCHAVIPLPYVQHSCVLKYRLLVTVQLGAAQLNDVPRLDVAASLDAPLRPLTPLLINDPPLLGQKVFIDLEGEHRQHH